MLAFLAALAMQAAQPTAAAPPSGWGGMPAAAADFTRKLAKRIEQLRVGRAALAKPSAQGLQQMAERALAIRLPHGQHAAVERRRKIGQVAVMREDPVAAP